MDNNLIDSYLDNIAELIIDEDKIVTYKTLSRKFGIHVNTAKQLIYKFLSDQKTKGQILSATYLLAGKLPDGSFNVTIVSEENLNTARSKFKEITSEHVYSIHKGKNFVEVKLLCDTETEKNNVESSDIVIKCSKSIIRATKIINRKNENQNKEPSVKSKIETKQVPEKAKEETLFSQQANKITRSPEKKEKESLSKSPKKTNILDSKSKTNADKEQGNKKQKGNIVNFFANAAQKSTEKSLKNKNVSCNNENINISPKIVNKDEKREEEIKEVVSETKRSFSKENKNRKGRNKRKRIQVLSDSEDENCSSSESDKEEPQCVEESPATPPLSDSFEEEKEQLCNDNNSKNKRKKRKIVDKTVMNEDGYMETKKEVVLETDSEEEEPEKPTGKKQGNEEKKIKLSQENEKTKPLPSNARKQSSLLNFFKKN